MKLFFYTAVLSAGFGLSNLANAQDASYSVLDRHQSISTTAGFHIVVPLGNEPARHVQNRARFGLMLDLSRQSNSQNFVTPNHFNTNLLDLGWQFNGQPTMILGGHDIYTPLFTTISAHEKHEPRVAGIGISKNTILIIAGGALAAGAAVALANSDGNDDSSHEDNDNH
ncbi:MAG: hypothetical protein COA91_00260 [Robiginitomaculum sp.]|nr:MAG: hypothetical protein COA91_00260 [Robiginitomaculum sp.]